MDGELTNWETPVDLQTQQLAGDQAKTEPLPSSHANLSLDLSSSPAPAFRGRSSTFSSPRLYSSKPVRTRENSNNILLFYAPEMASLAQEMFGSSDKIILGKCNFDEFPDKWPKLFIEGHHLIKQNSCCFLASFHSPEVMFAQLSAIYEIAKYRARNYKIIVPYFPTGTMDRISKPGEIATAMSLARMLNATPLCATGPPTIQILDIHALQEKFYFSDNVLVELKSAVWLLIEEIGKIKANRPEETIAIAFPDDGAAKRFKSKFGEIEHIIFEKRRVGNQRIVRVVSGVPKGKHVLIIDDLIQTGGTILECVKVIKECGASRVSAYVTHGVFPNESFLKFFPDQKTGECLLETFYITNTIPTVSKRLENQPPFRILSVAPVLLHTLLDDQLDYYEGMKEVLEIDS
jgi:ribose-phosphate pyrophosphokinase